MNKYDRYWASAKCEEVFEWKAWIDKIPSLNFKKEWDVKIVPPFCYAIIRFQIYYNDKFISVYLDGYDLIGCVGEPYWEIYYRGEDCDRFLMNDTESLMKRIEEILEDKKCKEDIK